MSVNVDRKSHKFYPDPKRVILRYFNYNKERSTRIVQRILGMSEDEVSTNLMQILREFCKRHRNVTKVFQENFLKIKDVLNDLSIDITMLSQYRQLLIGSYLTMEYSVESAAFFNPSIVESPDQSDLLEGEKRFIISFRAIGEGHISSIVFRSGIINANLDFEFEPQSSFISSAEQVNHYNYNKLELIDVLQSKQLDESVYGKIFDKLGDTFNYWELKREIEMELLRSGDSAKERDLSKVLWYTDAHHEINFSLDTDLSGRVIFPYTETESKGMEDARFVKFTEDNGQVKYYATYTAYNGYEIEPKLLETRDFFRFKFKTLYGNGAKNKNLALFPRKVNGKYIMLSRIDGVNNYIMFSDNVTLWENPIMLQEPKYPWEFVQIGNCGSPIETEKGWLLITHGVGPMRKYCLGASLFDLNDPTKEIGRLKEPLIIPNQEEREGYVPNVVYSCGAILHKNNLVLPYGMSDSASGFATVELNELLNKIISDG